MPQTCSPGHRGPAHLPGLSPAAATGFAFICVTTSPTRRPMPAPGRQDNLIAASPASVASYAAAIARARTDRSSSFPNEDHWTRIDRSGRRAGGRPRRGGTTILIRPGCSRSPWGATSAWSGETSWPAPRPRRRFRPMSRNGSGIAAVCGSPLHWRRLFGRIWRRSTACDRQRAGRRMRVDKMLSPMPASLVGPEKLPAAASNGPRTPRCSRS